MQNPKPQQERKGKEDLRLLNCLFHSEFSDSNLIENDDGDDIKVFFESIRGKIDFIEDHIKNRGKGI